jgi:hypothetical protein
VGGGERIGVRGRGVRGDGRGFGPCLVRVALGSYLGSCLAASARQPAVSQWCNDVLQHVRAVLACKGTGVGEGRPPVVHRHRTAFAHSSFFGHE